MLTFLFGALGRALSTIGRRLVGVRRKPTWSVGTELTQQVTRVMLATSIQKGPAWLRKVQEGRPPQPPKELAIRFEPATVAGVDGLWSVPPEESEGVVVYLHGGGYVIGSPMTYMDLCGRIAHGTKRRVFCPDYRLAPENPFPAGHDDALAVCSEILEEQGAADVRLAGDSAGAGLVLGTLLTLRDQQAALPARAALLCPWVDPFSNDGTMISNDLTDIGPAAWIRWCADQAIAPEHARDPRVRPLDTDLRGLPSLHIQIGGAEMLRDQATELSRQLRAAGVQVDELVEPEMFHVWQLIRPASTEGKRAIDRLCHFLGD